MAFTTSILLLTLVMTNTVFAQEALPGEALYNWKLASESLWRAVAVDPLGTDLTISDRRINEFVAVSADEQRRTEVLLGYNRLLARFQDEHDEADRARIRHALRSQQDWLRREGLSIPALDKYFSGEISADNQPAP